MSDEIKLIGAEVIKLSLHPGDVLVFNHPTATKKTVDALTEVANHVFGVPCLVLHSGVELKAVLSVGKECQEIAASERARKAEAEAKRIQGLVAELTNT